MQLKGRRALVTGATGGIGQAIARELAARGCAVTVTGRREQQLQRLVNELGPSARALTADLTNLDEMRDLMTARLRRMCSSPTPASASQRISRY